MKLKLATLATTFASGLLLAGALFAADTPDQPDGPPPPRGMHGPGHNRSAEQQLARLTERLQLSDEQSAQLLEVLQSGQAKRRSLQKEAMEQVAPEICATMEETEQGILAILTADQAAEFDEMKAARQERMESRGGGQRGSLDCSSYGG